MSTAVSATTAIPLIIPAHPAAKEVELARHTIYLELTLRAIGDQRKVPEKDIEVGEADKRLFHLSKKILESAKLDAIHSFDDKTRALIYARCHPFRRGVYFLPLTLAEEVDRELKERRALRLALVSDFLDEYPRLCRQIATRLSTKYYNARDYPPVDVVAARFVMSWQPFSFGLPDALAAINMQMFDEARQQQAGRVKAAAEHIEQLMRAQALELVAHLRDRLQPGPDGRKKVLHESALTNLAEYLAYFDHKNVTCDDELKAVVDDLRAKLAGTDVEAIKNTDALRDQLCKEMSTITEHLETMVQRVPKRQITLH